MQPRWEARVDENDNLECVGGIDLFDIWVRKGRAEHNMPFYVRVIWGNGTLDWDSAWGAYRHHHPRHGMQTYLKWHHKEEGRPDDEATMLIVQYIILFVPELSDHLIPESTHSVIRNV